VQRFIDDLFNNQSPAAAEAIVAEDIILHHPTRGEGQGRRAALEAIREMHAAFPDLVITVKQLVAEGDWVTAYWSATGTHR
jgi:predicted ester cyclase